MFDYFEKILRLDVIQCLPIKNFMFFRFGVRNYIVDRMILHRSIFRFSKFSLCYGYNSFKLKVNFAAY